MCWERKKKGTHTQRGREVKLIQVKFGNLKLQSLQLFGDFTPLLLQIFIFYSCQTQFLHLGSETVISKCSPQEIGLAQMSLRYINSADLNFLCVFNSVGEIQKKKKYKGEYKT